MNDFLNELSDHPKNKNTSDLDSKFLNFVNGLGALEIKWLIRIILKDLKIKFDVKEILETLHLDAYKIYQSTPYLSVVCQRIYELEAPGSNGLQLFVPVLPQLCERININQIDKIIKQYNFYVETKLDGERQQLHRDQNKYAYFTRRGYTYTDVFGKDPTSGCLTPFIHKTFKDSVKSCILDGEMMVWHIVENRFVIKGEGVNFYNYRSKQNEQICFCVFDILYLNGESMINKPYYERVRVLKNVFHDTTGRIIKTVPHEIKTQQEFMDSFNKLVSNNEEGMVAKQMNSKYCPGQRGAGWFKFKPDYIEGSITDLDLVILGLSLHKNTNSKINEIIAGVKDNDSYLALVVLSSGLSKNQQDDLCDILSPVWMPTPTTTRNNQVVANVSNINFGHLKPQFYIEPKFSVVVQVKAAELQKSNIFPTVFTLRFPRIVCIRKDKKAEDICTLDEFKRLYCTDSKRSIVKIAKQIKVQGPDEVLLRSVKDDDADFVHRMDICILNSNLKNQPLLKKKILQQKGRIVVTPSKYLKQRRRKVNQLL